MVLTLLALIQAPSKPVVVATRAETPGAQASLLWVPLTRSRGRFPYTFPVEHEPSSSLGGSQGGPGKGGPDQHQIVA